MLVVTRHPETIKVLKENGIISDSDTLMEHVKPRDVMGKDVLGTLPINLASYCRSVTFVKWNIPQEARGKQWTLKQTRKYYAGVETYYVRPMSKDEPSLYPALARNIIDFDKKIKISGPMQNVACDILSRLEATLMSYHYNGLKEDNKSMYEEVMQIFDKFNKKYNLNSDPFTGCICTDKQWSESSQEYNRQQMEARYGHHDGLD